MKIALMSGAYLNAGDFLIEKRCKELLEANICDAQIDVLKRNISYDDDIERLNAYDLIVFGGGPGFQKKLYPDRMPFVTDLSRIKTPIAIMGWGWKGKDISAGTLYNDYRFHEKMMSFLRHISETGAAFSCRDWHTVSLMRNCGFESLRMTGCPAWYNSAYIDRLQFKEKKEIRKICISDPAYPQNQHLLEVVLAWVRDRFPDADIKLLNHRGGGYRRWFFAEASDDL